MSTLKELLMDVPVEWKALSKISRVLRGRRLTKNQLSSEGYPVYHGGLEPLGYYDNFNRPADSVMIINVGASAGNVGFSPADFWSSDGCYCLEQIEKIYSRYLFYFLLSQEFYLKSKVRYAGIPTLDATIIENVQIPIPYPNDPQKSLGIQQEIVRVLDGLSEQNKALTSALAQEIDNRKKQYEYYREELFCFEGEEVVWITLGEVLKIKNGKDYKEFNTGNIPVYGSGGIMTYIDTFVFDRPSVLIPRKGSLKNLFYIDVPFWTVDTIFWTDINIKIVKPKFVYHYLKTQKLEELNMAGGVPSLTQTVLNKLRFPVSTIQEQERIVRLLDKFDEATINIVAQLENEIELRDKQYEYYRNLLLTFPKDN